MSTRAGVSSMPFLSVNGVRVADDAAQVSARDRGFTLADGLFETMRVVRGRVFQLQEHLSRLGDGLVCLRMPPVPGLRDWVSAAVRDAGLQDAALRVTITRGPGGVGLAPPARPAPTVVIAVTPLPDFGAELHVRGLSAHIASGRRNDKGALAGVKTLAYTENVVALLEARERGADEALLLDTDGHLCEASASNLFLVVGGSLVTPPSTCGALPGITRATVLDLASRAGLPVEERVCVPDDLAAASEAFLTSSLRGLAPLVRVNGRPVGDGAPGPVMQQLWSLHAELMESGSGG